MADHRPNGWACLCRFGGIGDNLIVSVAFPGLKRKYGKLEVISGGNFWNVFENNPHIDRISLTKETTIPVSPPEAWQGWFETRAHEYDFFVHLSHSLETLLALFPTQTQFWWPAAYRRQMCGHSYLETVLDICGLPHEFGPLFFPTEAERNDALETKQKIGPKVIGWVISGTRIDKKYPYAPQAIARILRETGLPVAMLGMPPPSDNINLAQGIMADVGRFNSTTENLHLALSPNRDNPTWPVRRILAFAQVCDIVITPDTGPAWAVAFEQNRKVVLLSHASLENITKHWVNTITLTADQVRVPCWPCHQLHNSPETCTPNADRTGAACISDISVQKIVDTVKSLL